MNAKSRALIVSALFALSSQMGVCAEKAPMIDNNNESYGDIVGRKVSSGFANLVGAPIEIPKNVLLTVNSSNTVYGGVILGTIGGMISGVLHMGARMGIGVADLITAPIPTAPMVSPLMVWDDFESETSYGKVLKSKQPVK